MRGGQIDSRNRTELSLRKIRSELRQGVLLSVVAMVPVVLGGCSGLVSGASTAGNPPPPSALDITNVQVTSITTSTAQIVWTTNVAANSAVDYGTSTSYGSSTPVDSAMVTSHQVTLSSLAAGTTYYYQVNSTDSKGNHGHGGNNTFKTAGFNISGTINPTAAGNRATVALSGAASTTTTADSFGNYTFTELANGTYTISPSHAGFTFTPSSQSMTVNGANVTGVNFTGNAAPVAPTITTQPANQTVTAGQTAAFTVVAGGTAPLSYQWQKNGANIAGATAVSYTTPVTTTSDNGASFAVVVSNTAGTVTSAVATLTVNAAPVAPTITTSALPIGQVGVLYTATLAASGGTPPYAWSLVSGSSLPTGLILSAAGTISGTPTSASTSIINVQVTDSSNQSASSSFTMDITSGVPSVCVVGPPYTSSTSTATIPIPAVPAMGAAGSIVVDTSLPTSAGSFNQIVRATDENTVFNSLVNVAAGTTFTTIGSSEVNRWSGDDTHLLIRENAGGADIVVNFQPDCTQPGYMNPVIDKWDSNSARTNLFDGVLNAQSATPILYGESGTSPLTIQTCTHNHAAGTCPLTTLFTMSANIPTILDGSWWSGSATFDSDANIAYVFAGNARLEGGKQGQDNGDIIVACVRNYDGQGHNGCRFYDTELQVMGGDFGPQCGTGDGVSAPACTNVPPKFLMHNVRVNHRQDGVLNDLWVDIAPSSAGIGSAPFWWQVNTTAVSQCTSSPLASCEGHRVTGSTFVINKGPADAGIGLNDSRTVLKRDLTSISAYTILNTPPAPNTTASQDSYSELALGESYTYLQFFNDSSACTETAAYFCELVAVETNPAIAEQAKVFRFAHNFQSSTQFWAYTHGVPSPDGKFMAFPSDWSGTLASGRWDVFILEMK